MGQDEFENSLKLTKRCLLTSGIRITKRSNSTFLQKYFDSYFYYFNLLWLYTDVFGEINWLIDANQTGRSFVETCLTIPLITIGITGTFKSIYLYMNRELITEIIEKLREMYPNVNKCNDSEDDELKHKIEVEENIVNESTTLINVIVQTEYYITVIVVIAFPLMPIIAMTFEYYKTGILIFKYSYSANYFFDIDTGIMWPFVYFHHLWSTINVGLNILGADSLFYVVCVYIQMHFRLLCHRFENIVCKDREETWRNLTSAVRRHQELIKLVDQLEVLFSKSILFNIATSSVLLCLSGFIIMTLEDIGMVISFVTFLLHSVWQISLLCYLGDILMSSSMHISTAIYNSNWHEADQSTKKTMLFIIRRAQRPCKLTACKFTDLNMKTFTTIISRSWTYFALLQTMYQP